ncbi:nucleotidyl transferase AbiEii/AbiGii toxin family protein [Nocardia sp. AB354]|uniref:nucleotidyl transferase AbiEii/AbiGii toxin family protein n=1 Tax=Nocardia sp. AB354 TaxID=3413283 RepID=UPI003C13A411
MVNDEHESVAVQFGVSPEQVERDHPISHLLAAISRGFGDRLHFIGGTALARTHLVNGRLSEDIDLVALDNRTALAAELDAALPRSVARTYGRLEWVPPLSRGRLGWRSALRRHCIRCEMPGLVLRSDSEASVLRAVSPVVRPRMQW